MAACFCLCKSYEENLDAYFCLSTSYMKDMVGNMYYNLVVLALPCKNIKEELYCNKMVVLALPCRDLEEELYCNKMVVMFYSSMDI